MINIITIEGDCEAGVNMALFLIPQLRKIKIVNIQQHYCLFKAHLICAVKTKLIDGFPHTGLSGKIYDVNTIGCQKKTGLPYAIL